MVTYSTDLFVEPEQLRNGIDLIDLVFQNAERVQDQSIPAAQLPACSMGTDLRASTIVCRHATHQSVVSWYQDVSGIIPYFHKACQEEMQCSMEKAR